LIKTFIYVQARIIVLNFAFQESERPRLLFGCQSRAGKPTFLEKFLGFWVLRFLGFLGS